MRERPWRHVRFEVEGDGDQVWEIRNGSTALEVAGPESAVFEKGERL